ncbi:DUF3291 domain-containing protein [Streptomyces sp. NPDC002588]|uniref:DUF3291 domain-containing protein n=1 Tax=Streptomyces sp. NPDC002588 TaxID=3154419 RepID=UPI0033244A1E
MPTLRWTTVSTPASDTDAFAMASRFEVRSLDDVPRVFLKSLLAWKQVSGAPGAYGASLIAQPLERTFTFWQVPAADLPIDREDTRRRLAEQERAGA